MGRNKITKDDCILALKKAANNLGKSPTVSEYNEMDITPSSPTIMDRLGSWNEAKDVAGLEKHTYPQDVYNKSPPENLSFTQSEWKSLSRNKRNQLRKKSIVAERKVNSGCEVCGYDEHPSALDYHHTSTDKDESVSKLSSRGVSMDKIKKEIDKCVVLCANCHRIRHSSDKYE